MSVNTRHLSGEHAALFGEHAALFGGHVALFGEHAALFGEHVALFGEHVALFGEHVALFGEHVALFGEHAALFGEHPALFGRQAANSVTQGFQCTSIHKQSFLSGRLPALGSVPSASWRSATSRHGDYAKAIFLECPVIRDGVVARCRAQKFIGRV